jgi:hypothetical protein
MPTFYFQITTRLVFFIVLLLFAGKANAQVSPINTVKKSAFVSLGIGVSYTDVASLSRLIYQNETRLKENFSLSSSLMFGFYFNENSLLLASFNSGNSFNLAPGDDYLNLNMFSAALAYGYHFNHEKQWSFMPQLGLGVMAHEIIFDRGPNFKANATTQLSQQGTLAYLTHSRYLAVGKVTIMYKNITKGLDIAADYYSLTLGFGQSFGGPSWHQRYDQPIAGPALFNQIFSAQLGLTWRLWNPITREQESLKLNKAIL